MSAEGKAVGKAAEHVIAKAVEQAGVRDAEHVAAKEAEQAATKAAEHEAEQAGEKAAAKDLASARKVLDEGASGEKNRVSEILGKEGGPAARDSDFDQVTKGLDVKSYQTPKGETKVANLPDGTTVISRPSSDGRPTIELYTKSPKTKTKYRYGDS